MSLPAVVRTEAEPQQDDYLSKLIGYFDEAEDATREAREKSERDRDYYDNKQFTREEMNELRRRKQPAVSMNLIRPRVNYLLGLEKKQRTDPKAYPRNPVDEPAADAFTDGMRFVVDQSDYHAHRSGAAENIIVEGYGGVEWSVRPAGQGFRIDCTHVPWDRIIYDPHSVKPDFSDARFLGQVLWLDKDEALERVEANGGDVQEASRILEQTFQGIGLAQTFDDKPRQGWIDRTRTRVRVVNLWHRERGEWINCEYTRGGVLWQMTSPYVMKEDGDEEPYCPLVIESCYIDRENNRYGEVRDLIDPQDEDNKRRSKALHLLSVNGVVADSNAVENIEAARAEMARPDFWLSKTPSSELQIIRHADLAAGQAALGAQAREYILQNGANNALQGRVSPDQSGRAIEAQQAGGLIELGGRLDTIQRMDRQSFRIIAAMIQQFWTTEMWIRVTDDEMAPRYVGLNVPLYQDQETGMTGTERDWQEVFDQGGQPMLAPAYDEYGQPMVQNNVGALDVDIIVADAPDTINNSVEAYQALTQVLGMAPQTPPPVLRMLIEAHPGLTTRKKKQLLDMIEQMGQQPNPMAQAQQERFTAETEAVKAKGFKDMAQGEKYAREAEQPAYPLMEAYG